MDFESLKAAVTNNEDPLVIEEFFYDPVQRTRQEEFELLTIAVSNNNIPLLELFGEYLRFPNDPRILSQYTNNLNVIKYLTKAKIFQEDLFDELLNKIEGKDVKDSTEFMLANLDAINRYEYNTLMEAAKDKPDILTKLNQHKFTFID